MYIEYSAFLLDASNVAIKITFTDLNITNNRATPVILKVYASQIGLIDEQVISSGIHLYKKVFQVANNDAIHFKFFDQKSGKQLLVSGKSNWLIKPIEDELTNNYLLKETVVLRKKG